VTADSLLIHFRTLSNFSKKSGTSLYSTGAYDHPVAISDLVVYAKGSLVEEKYYVALDRSGRVQTWYCDSVESQERCISYDRVDSDAFKVAHG
jgi:hypothetical protein